MWKDLNFGYRNHFDLWHFGSGPGSGSDNDTEPIDERLCKSIAAVVTRGILNATPVIFGTIKEGMMEIVEERLKSF